MLVVVRRVLLGIAVLVGLVILLWPIDVSTQSSATGRRSCGPPVLALLGPTESEGGPDPCNGALAARLKVGSVVVLVGALAIGFDVKRSASSGAHA